MGSGSHAPVTPLFNSLLVAFAAVALATPFAIGAGWLMARRDFPGKSVLHMVLLSPLVLPPVVTGYLLLSALGRNSFIGALGQGWFGVDLSFNLVGAVIAAMVVGFPLYVAGVQIAIERVPHELEEMAAIAGASPWQVFRKVTLPVAGSGIGAGCLLAFARAMGEFGATVVLAGNLQGEQSTLALAIYDAMDDPGSDQQVINLTLFSILASFLVLVLYERLIHQKARSH